MEGLTGDLTPVFTPTNYCSFCEHQRVAGEEGLFLFLIRNTRTRVRVSGKLNVTSQAKLNSIPGSSSLNEKPELKGSLP